MTSRKLRIEGYYGQRTGTFDFIPDGIFLRLLLHRVDGFKIEHDINVDNNEVSQWIHYNKKGCGCGSFAGMKTTI
jgi:hypothetical protein